MSKMNLPNKLTIFRVILIIPFIILLLGGNEGWFGPNVLLPNLAALVVFVAASLTDLLDGKIARKYNLVTNFGKFMDPLADKLLVCSALICLVDMKRIPAWVVIVIISREFIISGFRLIASDNGVVIAASYWGKVKTVAQMIMTILLIADLPALQTVTWIVTAAAVVLTIISLADYLWKNRQVLMEGSTKK